MRRRSSGTSEYAVELGDKRCGGQARRLEELQGSVCRTDQEGRGRGDPVRLGAGRRRGERGVGRRCLAGALGGGEIEAGNRCEQTVQVRLGDVTGVLLALVEVREVDEIPELVLLRSGRRGASGSDRVGADEG